MSTPEDNVVTDIAALLADNQGRSARARRAAATRQANLQAKQLAEDKEKEANVGDSGHYLPGEVWTTSVIHEVVGSATLPPLLQQRLRLIIWAREELPERDRQTGEVVYRLLVTWGTTVPEYTEENKPTGRPFEIHQRSGGWKMGNGMAYPQGDLDRRIGRYVANDENYNGVAVMAEGYVRQLGINGGVYP